MGRLDVTFESKEGYLLVTATGRVTFSEALAAYKRACDLTVEKGLDQILVDALAVEGELSTLERYDFGRTMAEYCKSRSINPKVATVGKPPTITQDGFGALVASNRGLTAETFSDLQRALDWLNAFRRKT